MKHPSGTIQENRTDPIVFYFYFDMSDPAYFCDAVERRFRESGHTRPIVFRSWNCYNELPPEGADLYCYDANYLTSLAESGLIRELPDVIDTSDVFEWLINTTKVTGKLYSFPVICCSNVLISRKSEDTNPRNIFEIKDKLVSGLQSLVLNYFLHAFCSEQTSKEEAFESLKHVRKLIGNTDDFEEAHAGNMKELSRKFVSGEAKYILGFTETLRFLPKDDYILRLANFSKNPVNEVPLIMADVVSMGRNVSGEKLLDCLDLMEILCSPSFSYDLCFEGGTLQYMIPPFRSVYPRLIAEDDIYTQIYDIVSNPNNCTFRYGPGYFGKSIELEKELCSLL